MSGRLDPPVWSSESNTHYPFEFSWQAKEDTELPTIDPTLPPFIETEDLNLWPDGRHHFATPCLSILFGVDCLEPNKQHPDFVPPAVHWLWIAFCITERAGLLVGLDGPTADKAMTMINDHIQNVDYALQGAMTDLSAAQFAFMLAMAKALASLATPLRRSGQKNHLRPLCGGKPGWKPTMVFNIITDILKREVQVKIAPRSLRGDQRTMDFAFYTADDVRNYRHQTHSAKHITMTNWDRLKSGKDTRLFPNDRSAVLAYYKAPDNAIRPHTVPTPQTRTSITSGRGDAVMTSSARWEGLREMDLGDMRCHKRHDGGYLICRVLTPPMVGKGIAIAVEDRSGRAITLEINNLTDNFAVTRPYASYKDIYPVGAVLAVKEPYVCLGKVTGIAEIRVDNPLEVEVWPSYDQDRFRFDSPSDAKPVTDPAWYKDRGNEAIKAGDHLTAERHYTLGIRCCTTDETKELELALRLNRCLANISMKRFGPALAECLDIEETYTGHFRGLITTAQRLKLVFRKLQSAFGLRVWHTAERTIRECKDAKLEPDKWKPYAAKIKLRQAEAKGKYDLERIIMDSVGKRDLGLADFVGTVEVRDVPGRGRGLFVTRDVDAGELLLVERALVSPTSDNSVNGRVNQDLPMSASQRKADCEVPTMVQEMIADPSLAPRLNALYPHPRSYTPFLTEEERLDSIRKPLDSFNVDQLLLKSFRNIFGSHEVDKTSQNLFGGSSMLNHSCLPTATHLAMGEHDFMWAAINLKAGDELTFSYVDPDRSYESRTRSFRRTWHFKCDCLACIDDAKDDDKERERLMTKEWPTVKAEYEAASRAFEGPSNELNETETALLEFMTGQRKIAVLDTEKMDNVKRHHEHNTKAANALLEFCDKLEKTYAKDRKAPKNALISVYEQMQEHFSDNFPRGCIKPTEGYMLLLKLQGVVPSTPVQRKKTGLAVARLPVNASERKTARPMLAIAMMLRMSGRRDEAATWSKSAVWAYKAIRYPVAASTNKALPAAFAKEPMLINGMTV